MRKAYLHKDTINFKQNFYPVNKHEHYLFDVYRFKVFRYYPTTRFIEYVKYYVVESENETEQAIFAINFYRENIDSKFIHYQIKFLVKNGDVELFSYVKHLLMDKLFERENEFIKGQNLELTIDHSIA